MTKSAGPALKRLWRKFGDRVAFVFVYVREAHPGEKAPQPQTLGEKLAAAMKYEDRDRIPFTVAVDSMDGEFHRALGENVNSVHLADEGGTIRFRSLWAGAERPLRRALTQLTAGEPVRRDSRSRLLPGLRGLGVLDETLGEAGKGARHDMFRAVPPIAGLGLIARVFWPLPPLIRSLAALGLVFVSVKLISAQAKRTL